METTAKPENLTVYRKKWLTALGGIIYLIVALAFIGVLIAAYYLTDEATLKELKTEIIISFVGVGICSFILIVYSALCFLNLRYPVILATDEKGLYDYSGFIHGGFISWSDIRQITGSTIIGGLVDVFADNASPHVKVELKNYRLTFANRNRFWKIIFLLSGFGCLSIRTLCSPLSRRNTLNLLNERLAYYTANTETER